MYLPDHELRKLCVELNLIVPYDPNSIGAASIDLHLGTTFASPQPLNAVLMRGGTPLSNQGLYQHSIHEISYSKLRDDEKIVITLEPNQTVLCHSVETVSIPCDHVGLLSMRSTFARKWLDHSAADFIQPGFVGTITYELRNNGPRPFDISTGDAIMQLSLARMTSPAEKAYSGRYQNQQNEVHAR